MAIINIEKIFCFVLPKENLVTFHKKVTILTILNLSIGREPYKLKK